MIVINSKYNLIIDDLKTVTIIFHVYGFKLNYNTMLSVKIINILHRCLQFLITYSFYKV